MSLRERLLKNSLTTIISTALGPLVSLIVTPLLLMLLGVRQYGIWQLLLIFVYCAAVADLGIPTAITKWLSERKDGTDHSEVDVLLGWSFLLYTVVAFIFSSVLFFARGFVVAAILGLPVTEQGESADVLAIGCLVLVLTFFYRFVCAVLEGVQRLDLANWSKVVGSVVSAVGSLGAAWLGYGLIGMMWVYAGSALLQLLLTILFAHGRCPGLRFRRSQGKRIEFGRLLRFGFAVQWVGLISQLWLPATKLPRSRFPSHRIPSYARFGSPRGDVASGVLSSCRTNENKTQHLVR
jgi:O-antigen/teichoic acid export membrane protein